MGDFTSLNLHLRLQLTIIIFSINATAVTLERFGLPPAEVERRPRMSLKIAAHAVIATIRMEKASLEWRKQSAVKTSLRNAYKHRKGKPFVPAA